MVRLFRLLLRRIGFVAAFALAVPIGAAATQSSPPLLLNRPAPPPDGQTYFGFTFRLWDSTDPLWGDTRPFKTRIADSIQNELAGKRPTFLTVYAPWCNQNGTPAMFNSLRSYIATVRTVEGGRRLLHVVRRHR
jgi:hypothetical protein